MPADSGTQKGKLIVSNKLLCFPQCFLTLIQPCPNCRRYYKAKTLSERGETRGGRFAGFTYTSFEAKAGAPGLNLFRYPVAGADQSGLFIDISRLTPVFPFVRGSDASPNYSPAGSPHQISAYHQSPPTRLLDRFCSDSQPESRKSLPRDDIAS